MIPVFVCIFMSDIKGKTLIAFGIYVAAWMTDVLDGYLARRNNWITELGKILDPLADKMMQFVAVICLVIAKRLSWVMIAVVFFKELFMLIGAVILAKKVKSVTASSWFGKLTTFLLFVSVAVLLIIEEPSTAVIVTVNTVIVGAELFALIMYLIKFINFYRKQEFINIYSEKGKE